LLQGSKARIFVNFLTLCNLTLGSLALILVLENKVTIAAGLVLIAVLVDGMDGRIARLLKSTSPLGKELDSLCDLVSFGVAPAILIYYSAFIEKSPIVGSVVVVLYILCGAYRLARFNVQKSTQFFVGVPITIAGMFMALFILSPGTDNLWLSMLLTLMLAFLMVSPFKIPKI
jgi:CDP-diacylglycerol--serine O-phosphatidyltransferase